jgi:hypothetical protein
MKVLQIQHLLESVSPKRWVACNHAIHHRDDNKTLCGESIWATKTTKEADEIDGEITCNRCQDIINHCAKIYLAGKLGFTVDQLLALE